MWETQKLLAYSIILIMNIFRCLNLLMVVKSDFVNKNFLNEEEYESHISFIKSQNELLDFNNRTCEVRNWLNYIRN